MNRSSQAWWKTLPGGTYSVSKRCCRANSSQTENAWITRFTRACAPLQKQAGHPKQEKIFLISRKDREFLKPGWMSWVWLMPVPARLNRHCTSVCLAFFSIAQAQKWTAD
jgi:hypothetical protein